MSAHAGRAAGSALLALVALTACSQAAALAPVGGNRLAEVRFAALDVLTAQQVDVLVAPVCTASGPDDATITCTGTTSDGAAIGVSSTASDQATMSVTVGGTSIFRGAYLDILDRAARAS